jgi:hypothetical protein
MVSFTPWLLYPRGKSHRYTLDRRLGGLQSQRKFLTLPGFDPDSVVQPVASRYPDYVVPGLGQFKNPMTSSGIEPGTFRLIA